jgi:hypothetical protein
VAVGPGEGEEAGGRRDERQRDEPPWIVVASEGDEEGRIEGGSEERTLLHSSLVYYAP